MITYGDGVADLNVKELIEFHKSHGKTITITGVHPPARFGELIEKDNKVVSFEEKPQTSVGIINGGFMVFNRNLFDYLSDDNIVCIEWADKMNSLLPENTFYVNFSHKSSNSREIILSNS